MLWETERVETKFPGTGTQARVIVARLHAGRIVCATASSRAKL